MNKKVSNGITVRARDKDSRHHNVLGIISGPDLFLLVRVARWERGLRGTGGGNIGGRAVLTGMVGDDVIQLGPSGISTAQLGSRVLPANPPDDRLPTDTLHIDIYEGNITSDAGSKGCVMTTLLATLVGDNLSDLITSGGNDAFYALFNRGENYVSREDYFVSFPEHGSGGKWRGTMIGGSVGRWETPHSSIPWWQVWRDTTSTRSRILWYRPLSSANSYLYQAADSSDGPGADFDRFATNHVGLGQNRARPWIGDHKSLMRRKRIRRSRTRGRFRCGP